MNGVAMKCLNGLFLPLVLCSVALADPVALTKVVDSSDGFFSFDGAPALNNSGEVAFVARRNGLPGSGVGVFRATSPASIIVVAHTGGSFDFFFAQQPAINNSGFVSFHGKEDNGTYGIWKGDGTTTTAIVSGGASTSTFNRTNMTINESGAVAYREEFSGIYVGDGTGPAALVYSAPADFSSSVAGEPILNDGGEVMFTGGGTYSGGPGFGTHLVRGDGGPVTLLFSTTSGFLGVAPFMMNNAGAGIFRVSGSGGARYIMAGSGGGFTILADNAGVLDDFFQGASINNLGEVAFVASLDGGGAALYYGTVGGGVLPIIATGDTFGAQTITDIALAPYGLNDGGLIALHLTFSGPGPSQGIYLFQARQQESVPEPAGLLLALLGTAGVFGRRRRGLAGCRRLAPSAWSCGQKTR